VSITISCKISFKIISLKFWKKSWCRTINCYNQLQKVY